MWKTCWPAVGDWSEACRAIILWTNRLADKHRPPHEPPCAPQESPRQLPQRLTHNMVSLLRIDSPQLFSHKKALIALFQCVAALLIVGQAGLTSAQTAKRPNIVWIMSEDNSADYLRLFNPQGAATPNIEAMAKEGIVFAKAFSNAPVCSVARTTLVTSCYAPRIATQFHRKMNTATLPGKLKMFPAYLRQAGYYTTNNSKEDYNAKKSEDVWDQSNRQANWRNRPTPETPFFHVQTYTDSHESRLHFSATQLPAIETDPQAIKLQPYFPDTPLFRHTHAYYHDRMKRNDQLVGEVLEKLKADGVLENTFLFYFGDHGGVMPRSKGYAYESGLHVPLVIRVPENFRNLPGRDIDTTCEGFVQFVDFGPTVLNLAGAEIPDGIDGRAFLGPDVDPASIDKRNQAFGYADRFDEKYDLVRTLRVGNWKYIRNFEPFYPDALQNNYRYIAPTYQEWRRLWKEGKLTGPAKQFFLPKAAEGLYDLSSDPYEINNLASDPANARQLRMMRERLNDRLKSMPDLSFLTEAVLLDEALQKPTTVGQANIAAISHYIDTVNMALLPKEEALAKLAVELNPETQQDPWARYWALVACSTLGKDATPLIPKIQPLLLDREPLVVARAAEFLVVNAPELPTYRDVPMSGYMRRSIERSPSDEENKNHAEALLILNSIVYLHDFHDFEIDTTKFHFLFKVSPKSEVQRRLDYLQGKLTKKQK